MLAHARQRRMSPQVATGLRKSLVGYWPLSEAAGPRNDLSGNDNHMGAVNGVGTAAGPTLLPLASAFVLASSQYLTRTQRPSLHMEVGVRMSACGWVWLDTSAATVQTFMSEWAAVGARCFVVRTLSSRFSFSVTADGSTAATVSANTFGLPSTGTWYFIVVYYDRTNIGISVNGGAFDTAAHSTDIFVNTQTPFELGRAASNNQWLDGRMAGWGLWKRVITAAEIAYLYNGGSGRAWPWVPGAA